MAVVAAALCVRKYPAGKVAGMPVGEGQGRGEGVFDVAGGTENAPHELAIGQRLPGPEFCR